MTNKITRRSTIALGAAAGFAVAGLGTAAAQSTPETSSATDGEWSFTDDRGVTVTLPQAPQNIAGHARVAGALYDYGISIPIVLGTLEKEDGTPTSDLGEYPVDSVETWLGT